MTRAIVPAAANTLSAAPAQHAGSDLPDGIGVIAQLQHTEGNRIGLHAAA